MRLQQNASGASGSLGKGPYDRLVLRGVTVIDGTGAPSYGPADVVLERGRISAIVSAGRNTDMTQAGQQAGVGTESWELPGHYVLPGLIDAHAHIAAAEQGPDADYSYRLWLGHGITSVRETGCLGNGTEFTVREARRGAANEITAPRITPYAAFGAGRTEPFRTERDAARCPKRPWHSSLLRGRRTAPGTTGVGPRAPLTPSVPRPRACRASSASVSRRPSASTR